MFFIHDHGARIESPNPPPVKQEFPKLEASKASPAVDSLERTRRGDHTFPPLTAYDNPSKNMGDRTAQGLMTAPPITLFTDDKVSDALGLFAQHGFRHIPIIDRQLQLRGLISERDIYKHSSSLAESASTISHSTRLEAVMVQRILTATADTQARHLAAAMVHEKVGMIPVEKNGEVIGIVTRGDLLRIFVEQMPLEYWA